MPHDSLPLLVLSRTAAYGLVLALVVTLVAAAGPGAAALPSRESVRIDLTVLNTQGRELSEVAVTLDSTALSEPMALVTDRRGAIDVRLPVDPETGGRVIAEVEDTRTGWTTVFDDVVQAGERLDLEHTMADPLAFMRFDSGCNVPPEGECGGNYPGIFDFDGVMATEENEAGFANDGFAVARPEHFDGDVPVAVVLNRFEDAPPTLVWLEAPFMSHEVIYPDLDGDGLDDVVMWDSSRSGEPTRVWTYAPAADEEDEFELGGEGGWLRIVRVAGDVAAVWTSSRLGYCRTGVMDFHFLEGDQEDQTFDLDAGEFPPYCLDHLYLGYEPYAVDLDGDGIEDMLYTTSSPRTNGIGFLSELSGGGWIADTLGDASSYWFPEPADIDGDGVADLFVSSSITGVTNRWWVWESDRQRVEVVDVGTHGETIMDADLVDGDGDGLPELLGAYTVDASHRGWEVYEHATGDYFEVVLPVEADRGPSPTDYPPEWFD